MVDIPFTVDSALLRELGARLVGQPHIALAELIKNSFDADARNVVVHFEDDQLVIEDDGHGMSFDTFVARWMRIGSTHKKTGEISPELGRILTGSKGVGRLAAQILANEMEVESVALLDPATAGFDQRVRARTQQLAEQVTADVDWTNVDRNDELTQITVPVRESEQRTTFAGGSNCGTRLTLRGLVEEWTAESFRALAQEIWVLQPPFAVESDDAHAFSVKLVSPYGDVMEEFGQQMRAILENWRSFITFKLVEDDPARAVSFEFDPLQVPDAAVEDLDLVDDETQPKVAAPLAPGLDPSVLPSKLLELNIAMGPTRSTRRVVRIPHCAVDQLSGEIRVFNLTNRQANNVLVEDARKYMSQFGGVHIYDSDFRLPYYGPQDWLDLERDAARRISRSRLLPANMRPPKAMQDLPARRRIFGVARISTAHEVRLADVLGKSEADTLAIQSSRDRLVTNRAQKTLTNCVRLALDLYAVDIRRAKSTGGEDAGKPISTPTKDIGDAVTVLQNIKQHVPAEEFEALVDYLSDAEKNARRLEERTRTQSSLLGSLATVGMTTLAWDHESTKQRLLVKQAAERMERATVDPELPKLIEVVQEESGNLRSSVRRLEEIATLFKPVLSTESRNTVTELRAARVIPRLVKQLRPLARGAVVDCADLPEDLKLAAGTHAGWTALFQNLLINAFAAVLGTDKRDVRIDGTVNSSGGTIRIQDTGTGIDLARAESFFEPFERGGVAEESTVRLGLGGTGLGLTIVRVIANDLGVDVRFVRPDKGFSTCVRIDWK